MKLFLLFIVLAASFCSCSILKKSVNKSGWKIDSLAFNNSSTTFIAKHDSAGNEVKSSKTKIHTDSVYTKVTVEEFFDSDELGYDNDYPKPVETTKISGGLGYTFQGFPVSPTKVLYRKTITETGKLQKDAETTKAKTTEAVTASTDSSTIIASGAFRSIKENLEIDKNTVRKTLFPWWMILFLSAVGGLILFRLIKDRIFKNPFM